MTSLASLSPVNGAGDQISANSSRVSFHSLGRRDFSVAWERIYMSSPPPTPYNYIIFPNVSMFNSGQAFKSRAISDYSVVGLGEKLYWSLRFSSFSLFSPPPNSLLHRLYYLSLCDHRTQCVLLGLTNIISIFVNFLPYSLSQFNAIWHLIESLVHVSFASHWNVISLGAGTTFYSSVYFCSSGVLNQD